MIFLKDYGFFNVLDDINLSLLKDFNKETYKEKTHKAPVPVKKEEDHLVYEFDMPGVKKSEVSIEYRNKFVKIVAASETAKQRHYSYNFYVGDKYDPKSIDASLTDGVLYLKIDKIKEKEDSNVKIQIK